MVEARKSILELRDELLHNQYLKDHYDYGELGIHGLAEFGLMTGGMLVRTVVSLHEGRQISSDQVAIAALNFAYNLGKQDDTYSNNLMEEIFGTQYSDCLEVDKQRRRYATSPYQEGYIPRDITQADEELAVALDEEMAERGRKYLLTPEGHIFLSGRYLMETEEGFGCPLLAYTPNGQDGSMFDTVVMTMVDEALNPESQFYKKGYWSPAEWVLRNIRGELERPQFVPIEGTYNWQLPQLESVQNLES